MFGLTKKRDLFSYAAFGKHPVEGDFIRIGTETPLLGVFSSWMETGFSRLPSEIRERKGFLWRFWSRGPGGKLILGLVKSSEDSHGRIHPFLVLGEGRTKDDLSGNWDVLPLYCDHTWHDLDRYTRKKITSSKDLRKSLSRIKPPESSLRPHLEKKERLKTTVLNRQRKRSGEGSDFLNKMNNVEGLSRLDSFTVFIDVGLPEDVLVPAVKFLSLLKARWKSEPRTVFIGGRGNKNRLIVMKRPLHTDDFIQLWSEPDTEV
jgi:type VI secretion system ImpM family protein